MQEKPLLTQLQLAYPNKFSNRCIFLKHELRTISPKENNPIYNTNCTNFVLPHFIIIKLPWHHPKPQMTTLHKKHEILQKDIYSSQ